jgi:hypothetical protein
MDFFIWNIKILIFLNFFGLTRVDPGWPIKPWTWPLGRVNPRAGFNNYGPKSKENFDGLWAFITYNGLDCSSAVPAIDWAGPGKPGLFKKNTVLADILRAKGRKRKNKKSFKRKLLQLLGYFFVESEFFFFF